MVMLGGSYKSSAAVRAKANPQKTYVSSTGKTVTVGATTQRPEGQTAMQQIREKTSGVTSTQVSPSSDGTPESNPEVKAAEVRYNFLAATSAPTSTPQTMSIRNDTAAGQIANKYNQTSFNPIGKVEQLRSEQSTPTVGSGMISPYKRPSFIKEPARSLREQQERTFQSAENAQSTNQVKSQALFIESMGLKAAIGAERTLTKPWTIVTDTGSLAYSFATKPWQTGGQLGQQLQTDLPGVLAESAGSGAGLYVWNRFGPVHYTSEAPEVVPRGEKYVKLSPGGKGIILKPQVGPLKVSSLDISRNVAPLLPEGNPITITSVNPVGGSPSSVIPFKTTPKYTTSASTLGLEGGMRALPIVTYAKGEGFSFGNPKIKNPVPTTELLGGRSGSLPAEVRPLAGKLQREIVGLTPEEKARSIAQVNLARVGGREKGISPKSVVFNVENLKNKVKASKIILDFTKANEGVFFGSGSTANLPKGYVSAKIGDIDIIFPKHTEATITKPMSDLAQKLRSSGENVEVSPGAPRVLQFKGGEKFLEVKTSSDIRMAGEDIAPPGFYGYEFPNLKKGKVGTTIPFAGAKSITAGEQLVRKAAASHVIMGEGPAEVPSFESPGLLGMKRANSPRGLKDVGGFVQSSGGIAAIKKTSWNPITAARGKYMEFQLGKYMETFTPDQQLALKEKLGTMTGGEPPIPFQTSYVRPQTLAELKATFPRNVWGPSQITAPNTNIKITTTPTTNLNNVQQNKITGSFPIFEKPSPSPNSTFKYSSYTLGVPSSVPSLGPSGIVASTSVIKSPISSPSIKPSQIPSSRPSPSQSPSSYQFPKSPVSGSPGPSPILPSPSPSPLPSPSPRPSPTISPFGKINSPNNRRGSSQTPSRFSPLRIGGEGKRQKGFDVYVRRQKKFRKVNPFPLTQETALGFGARTVRNTAAATFKIKPTNQEARPLSVAPANIQTFKSKNGMFIQPSRKSASFPGGRISTGGERLDITNKGIQMSRTKNKRMRWI
jgi:hypothetical protein